jgi:hypothetical protein
MLCECRTGNHAYEDTKMTFLTQCYDETKARGRHTRVPHLSVWFDDTAGTWKATCGGVFCDTIATHTTPEAAVLSAFANAEVMSLKLNTQVNPGYQKQ